MKRDRIQFTRTKKPKKKYKDTRPKVGRPSLYREDHPRRAYDLCMLGLTRENIAKAFGIDIETLYQWKRTIPEFSEALDLGTEKADATVAKSLYHRAIGYSHEETKVFCDKGNIVREDVIRHYPPEVPAAKMWLTNRRPKQWADNVNHVVSGPNGEDIGVRIKPSKIDLNDFTEAELALIAAAGMKLNVVDNPKEIVGNDTLD